MKHNTGPAGASRRMARVAVAMLAVAIATTGCGPAGSRTTDSPQRTPKEALLAAVPDEKDGPFRFSGKEATDNITGSVDPAAKGVEVATAIKDPEHGFVTNLGFLVLGEDAWIKISFTGTKGLTGLPKLPKGWMKLDRSKITSKDTVPTFDGVDQGNTGPLVQAATSVEDKGNGKYAGTIDLSSGPAADVLDADRMAKLGDAAKAVPFTAQVGADGNITALTLDLPAAGGAEAYQYVVNYTDFGAAPALSAPGDADPAPAAVYEMLNG